MNQFPKKTLYLLLVLIVVIALTSFVLWKGFTETTTKTTQIEDQKTEVDLDFSLLESKKVEYLQTYEQLSPFEDEMGRENPFSAYEVSTTTEASEE